MQQLHLAGLAACRIDSGKIIWTGYYGYQNLEDKTPVSKNTIFQIASLSKTITAAAISQLVAEGKLRLEDDINNHLPFRVRNPNFENDPITIADLLRHRSSIVDNLDYLMPLWRLFKGDSPIPLQAFVKEYLTPNGSNYDRQKNFLDAKPNTRTIYCNVGYALLGYLVELKSHISFSEYCKQKIFQPLGMTNAAWFLTELDIMKVATPYVFSDSLQQHVRYGHEGFPDYPAGTLRTSAEQLAHFLIAWTSNGKWQSKSVFDSATIERFTPSDVNLGCYTWFIAGAPVVGELLYFHNGSARGLYTMMGFKPGTRNGFIIFVSGRPDRRSQAYRKLFNDLVTTIYNIR